MRVVRILIVMAAVFAIGGNCVLGASEKDYTAIVDRLVAAYNAGDYDAIRQDFDANLSSYLTPEKTRQFFGNVQSQSGRITDIGKPVIKGENTAEFPLTLERTLLTLKITLDAYGKIGGLLLTPRVDESGVPARNHTALRLPFDGQWLVFWGGDTKEQNYHVDTPNQRHAFDFVQVGDDGKTFVGNGTRNEDYHCFGKELLAPADGTVIQVISGVEDNTPRSMNPYMALGNAVIIKLSDDEYAVFAHLKMGSARVAVGDSVARGQVIGLCGNSGNSSEPHLHFHLQHKPVIQDGLGIKCYFDSVVVTRNGTTETRTDYSPVKGDLVSPPK